MSDWKETNSTPERDSDGKGQVARTFKVWGASRFSIYNDPTTVYNATGIGLPGPNTSHPEAPELILDRYVVGQEAQGGIVLTAEALYSSDRRFRFPTRPPTDDPEYYKFNFATITRTFNIPIARRVPITAMNNDTEVVRRQYRPEPFPIEHSASEFVVEFNAPLFSPLERELIRRQHNKIHKIDDGAATRWFLFRGATTSQLSVELERVVYSWIEDPGTNGFPILPDEEDPDGFFVIEMPPPNQNWEGKQWVRPPFHELFYIPNQEFPGVVGAWDRVLVKEMDAAGHLTLPGF